MQQCLDELGLSGEGDTADGNVTLKYNTCLGACSQAPVIGIDHRLHGRITPETVRKQIARLENGAG